MENKIIFILKEGSSSWRNHFDVHNQFLSRTEDLRTGSALMQALFSYECNTMKSVKDSFHHAESPCKKNFISVGVVDCKRWY